MGGVVVAILLLLVVGVVIIALAIIIMRRRGKPGNIQALSNATYDGNNYLHDFNYVTSCLCNIIIFTCRSKPHWVTEWMWRSVCWYWSSSGAQYDGHERTTCAGMAAHVGV